ncbi:MAG: hypothetical protein ACI9WU_003529 [Myxococcota bacterium]|jgi:hypothetical protein
MRGGPILPEILMVCGLALVLSCGAPATEAPDDEGASSVAPAPGAFGFGGQDSTPAGEALEQAGDTTPDAPAPGNDQTVTPDGSAEPAPADPVDAENSAPTGGSALVEPNAVAEGDTVSCHTVGAVDAQNDAIVWLFSWRVNGEVVAGQTEPSITSDHFNKGDEVVCVATPTDGTAEGESVSGKTSAWVVNTPPSLQSATLTPTEAQLDDTFQCAFAGWSDPDPVDAPLVQYAWHRASAAGPVDLVGYHSATLAASVLTPGDVVTCTVTPMDDESTGPAVVSNPASVSKGPACQDVGVQLDLSVASQPPSILMVVDRSGSMYDVWGQTKSAVGAVLSDLGPEAETGLVLYPSGSSCSIAQDPQVPLGPNNGSEIVATMNEHGTGGSTPMGKAMRTARQYLETNATENTAVILAADGKPSDTCLEDCTGCDCTDESICLWCADLIDCTYNEVRKEVETLHELGVRTFVIGYNGGFGATGFLESLAVLGGTADVGDSPFYDAADGSTLGSVLGDIADSLQVCTTTVQMPGEYDGVVVSVAGAGVAEDGANGFGLTADGTLTLHGTACAAATTPGATVDVGFVCGD